MNKLNRLIRDRGFVASLRFIGSRFFRVQQHMVFEHDLSNVPSVDWPLGVEVVPLITAQDVTSEIYAELVNLASDNTDYLNDIKRGSCIGLVVRQDNKIVHFAFVMRGSRMLCLLGLPSNAALLGNAYTLPEFRGRGYQTRSITQRIKLASQQNFIIAYSETAPDNYTSQRCIKRGGMLFKGSIILIVIMNIFVIRWRSSYKAPTFSICTGQ